MAAEHMLKLNASVKKHDMPRNILANFVRTNQPSSVLFETKRLGNTECTHLQSGRIKTKKYSSVSIPRERAVFGRELPLKMKNIKREGLQLLVLLTSHVLSHRLLPRSRSRSISLADVLPIIIQIDGREHMKSTQSATATEIS